MEIIKGVYDLAFVVVLVAIAVAPRAIDAYLAVRNGKIAIRRRMLPRPHLDSPVHQRFGTIVGVTDS